MLLYEIDELTIGVAVDTDDNGTFETTITQSETPISEVYGDVNQDGSSNIADAVLLQKYLLSSAKINKYQYNSADLNGDGKVDAFDMILMRRLLVS